MGKFVCCETCPRSFHFTCVDPPLDENDLPDGEWHCRSCYTLRHPPLPYQRGIFSQLLNQLERRNPRQFQLPKRIRERFEHVSANDFGEYVDDIKPSRGKMAAIKDNDDPLKLLDKNGRPILCYRCSESAMKKGTQVVTCDVCSSSWHVDCLDQPIWTMGSRWKCPNHADQVIKLPRRPKRYKLVDTDLQRGFNNNGNIEVLDSSDEEELGAVEEIPFFDVVDTANGVAAKIPRATEKSFASDGIVYRLPERGIKLDFIQAVYKEQNNSYPDSMQSQILLTLDVSLR
jgi:hypothetical protein